MKTKNKIATKPRPYRVTDNTHAKIMEIKYKHGFKTIEDLFKSLIKNVTSNGKEK